MDSRKPLTAGEIEDLRRLVEEYRICGDWTFFERGDVACFLPRLLSLLTPPPDAAVREAVEHLSSGWGESAAASRFKGHVYTLIRAVQAPRLTPEQVEAVRNVSRKTESRQCICGDGYMCARCEILCDLLTAFPELMGEVGRGE